MRLFAQRRSFGIQARLTMLAVVTALPLAPNTEMHARVVATGQPQISDLIIGAVLRRPILVVGVPVFRDGQVVHVLAMGLGPELLSPLLEQQSLPADWTVGIFDRKGL